MKRTINRRWLTLAVSVFLFFQWAVLYLPHLRTAPAWYGDEGLALTAGLKLANGVAAHGSFKNTFWNLYAPYQPVYEWMVGASARIFGGDIVGGRLFNATLALAIALLIAFGGRRIMSAVAAFGSAVLFLGFEQSVIHFRWIFTHNLVALGFCITFLALSGRRTRRSDWVAGVGLAIGAMALPLAVYGVAAALAVSWNRPRSWLPITIPFAMATGASMAAGTMLHGWDYVWSDLQATAGFYTHASRENSGGLLTHFGRFFTQDGFHLLALGLALLALRGRSRCLAAGTLLIAVLLLQNRANLTVFYYQAIVITPLLCLGIGAGLSRGIELASNRVVLSKPVCRLLKVSPLLLGVAFGIGMVPKSLAGRIPTRIDFWTTQSIPEVEAAADWINRHTGPHDLVVCHQNIAWLLHCRTADYLQATTWQGISTWPFRDPLRRDQFLYAPDFSEARFAVVADIDKRWTFAQPGVAEAAKDILQGKWPPVWTGENYVVFKNPALIPKAE